MRPPESWQGARVTLTIAAFTAAAWLLVTVSGLSDAFSYWGGFIPLRFSILSGDEAFAPFFITPLTATLIHGNFAHLGFNLLILLFCGRSVETIIGPRQYVMLYLLGAYAAAAAHWLVNPLEQVPMIGASGAISAVIGAFSVLFGRNKVRVSNQALASVLNVLWLAAAWIVLQFIVGLTFRTTGAHVAIAAHIGGFLAGLLLTKPLLLLRYRTA